MEEFWTVGGTWAAPVIPSIRLKPNQTKGLITGAPFSALSHTWGMSLFPHVMGGTCFSAQSCCGGIYISLTLRRSSIFTIQQRQCNFSLLPKGSSCVSPSPSPCRSLSGHRASCASAAAWGPPLPRGAFLLLLVIFPPTCTEATHRRGTRTYLFSLCHWQGPFQASLAFGWGLVLPDLVTATSLPPFQVDFSTCCGLTETLNGQW